MMKNDKWVNFQYENTHRHMYSEDIYPNYVYNRGNR